MKTAQKGALALLVGLMSTGASRSEFVEISYAEFVREKDSSLNEIGRDAELDAKQISDFKRTVARYIFIGPCLGSITGPKADELEREAFSSTTAFVSYGMDNPVSRVLATMFGYLLRENLGRQPTEHTCRYAAETAFPSVSVGTKLRICFSEGKQNKPDEICKEL
jgi:hypothetical protein